MSSLRAFKQVLSTVSRLWAENRYDAALAQVEAALKIWPGNARLHILWASLVQLQEDPKHRLDEAKKALQQAIDLEPTSPAGAIELGHFLDAVEDNPRAASRAYADGVAIARQSLIEGLIGQAKALLQLGKREDALKCLVEVLHLTEAEPVTKRGKGSDVLPDVIFRAPNGRVMAGQVKGPFAEQIEELLNEVFANRSA
jgi:tetratricopeptide (TPR) repeat protein